MLAGRRVLWGSALLLVPTALAGLAVASCGPGIAEDLRSGSAAALQAAGIGGVEVAVSGRDVVLQRVPAGAADDAAAAVAAVDGVRAVAVGSEAVPPAEQPPSDLPPADVAESDPQPGAARAVTELLAAQPLLFGPDDPELTPTAAATVARLAELLGDAPDLGIKVEGHAADTPGSPQVAQALSLARARAVAAALAAGGVDPGRISSSGAGDGRPLATLEASRRVELVVVEPDR